VATLLQLQVVVVQGLMVFVCVWGGGSWMVVGGYRFWFVVCVGEERHCNSCRWCWFRVSWCLCVGGGGGLSSFLE
jgi:hypothetical protein